MYEFKKGTTNKGFAEKLYFLDFQLFSFLLLN